LECVVKPEEMDGLPVNKIINGDVLEALKRLPSDSIDCIVTSPPYWSLRDYGVEGQIGLEPTLDEYLDKLLQVTKELKRILKPTGVMFWNHGDNYSGSLRGFDKNGKNYVKSEIQLGNKGSFVMPPDWNKINIPRKSLCLQASRLAIRMIDEQGWILRNDIIWHKPNHMPESVKDRFTKAYEHVFMFVKKEKYWFDLDAVREPHLNKYNTCASRREDCSTNQYAKSAHGPEDYHPLGKNPGDVWVINTEPFPEAHFAVFPTKLVERCILAGCPEWICKKCGKPRERIVEKIGRVQQHWAPGTSTKAELAKGRHGSSSTLVTGYKFIYQTIGWTDCGCNAGWESGIVLDPFLGSGTTALVALKLGRNFIGIELNEEYCKMAYNRIRDHLNQQRLTEYL